MNGGPRNVNGIGAAITAIERYEFKYRIPPGIVPAVRRAVRTYCDVDAAGASGPYLISSLYFDSRSRVLYRHTKESRPRRFKLRVRRYISGPVFLEVKRREKGVIVKRRAAIGPEFWPDVLFDPRLVGRCCPVPADSLKVQEFLDRSLLIAAEPAVVVRYAREAYVSRVDDYARVTLDARLEARPPKGYAVPIDDADGWLPMDDPERCELPVSGVILELKSLTGVPMWMSDLVARFGLQATGFSKYSAAVEAVGAFPAGLGGLREPSRLFGGKASWI